MIEDGLRLYPAATGDVRMSKRFCAPALQTYVILQSGFFRLNV